VPPRLWDAYHLDALPARTTLHLLSLKKPRSENYTISGDVAEGLLVAFQRDHHVLFIDGIAIQHFILRDQAARAPFGKEDLVAELNRRLHLAPV